MKFMKSCLLGIAIGAGAILPGISSGVLCVIFGMYEKLLNSVLGFFKNVKENTKFLLPIIFGVGIGVILFGNLLVYLFEAYPLCTKFSFIGLILGSLPALLKTANSKKGFRLRNCLFLVVCFLLTLPLLWIENNLHLENSFENTNFLYLCFSGFIMSIGVVVPGVSSSVLLMILGTYQTYLGAIASIQFAVLIPMGIGLIIGGFLFLKLIQFCLEHYFSQTYYSVIGFVLGSVLILYTPVSFDFTGISAIVFLLLSFAATYLIEN